MGHKMLVMRECVNQDTGERVYPGDKDNPTIVTVGEMEAGRHLAEGNMVPYVKTKEQKTETRVIRPKETRKRRSKKRG